MAPSVEDQMHSPYRGEPLKPRPWVYVWGLRDVKGRPWHRPMSNTEMLLEGMDPEEYESYESGTGRWEAP